MRDTELPPPEQRPAKTWLVTVDVAPDITKDDWKAAAKQLAEALKKLDGVLAVNYKEDKPGQLDLSVKADQLLVKNAVEKAIKAAGHKYKNVAEVKAETKPEPAKG